MLGLQQPVILVSSSVCQSGLAATIDSVIGGLLGLGVFLLVVLPGFTMGVLEPAMSPQGGIIPARLTERLYPADRWRHYAMVRNLLLRIGLIPLGIGFIALFLGNALGGEELQACSVFL